MITVITLESKSNEKEGKFFILHGLQQYYLAHLKSMRTYEINFVEVHKTDTISINLSRNA